MNCPKCQQEMGNYEVSEHDYVICENKACEYWGILRLDLEEFDDEDNGFEESPVQPPFEQPQQPAPVQQAQPSAQQLGAVPPVGDDAAAFI